MTLFISFIIQRRRADCNEQQEKARFGVGQTGLGIMLVLN
jgi:hypothetical protein